MRRPVTILIVVLVLLILWLVVSPPRFWLNLTSRVEPTAAVGEQLVAEKNCRGCHRIGGQGALKAPALDDIVLRHATEDPALVTLRLWLRDPKGVKPNTAMPNFRLSDTEIEAILQYLQAQAEAASS